MDSITEKDWKEAKDRAQEVLIPRSQARKWLDLAEMPEELTDALDQAQGDAEEEAQFILICVRPGSL